MANIDLKKYGIKGVKEILYNPTYEVLYNEETKPGLEGFDKGQVTELGAINVMTGVYTGRSPKDKYIVYDNTTKEGKPGEIWWTTEGYPNDNHNMLVTKWACHATSIMKRTFIRVSAWVPQKPSTTKRRLPESCFWAIFLTAFQVLTDILWLSL